MTDSGRSADVAVIGAGAAGLAAAIFAGRANAARSILALDGAAKIGAKIRVSGGGRCNVTNAVVTPADFYGGSRHTIRRILSAFPVDRTIAFFREIGVSLHEEADGKLFPDTNDARTVVNALVDEARRLNVRILTSHRVETVEPTGAGFRIATSSGPIEARTVILATGGLSLPKTGSDGAGYRLAQSLGHRLVPTTPGLVPLVLADSFHTPLSGIAQPVEIAVRAPDSKPVLVRGALLWTHFGISGPAALDASRHWHRADLEGRPPQVRANFFPRAIAAGVERRLVEVAAAQPRSQLGNVLAQWLPARFVESALAVLGVPVRVPMAHLGREDRRRVAAGLCDWPLPVIGSRGYPVAEVTAGGVALDEIDPRTMESRICAGLHLVGEILDCEGRLGGFNFQWAWATGFVAGSAV